MKKEVIGRLILISILFIFLLYGISAAYEDCRIVARSACDEPETEGYIVMGLSSSTNAHGEFPDQGTYNYVLCCGIEEGNTSCTTSPSNKIIGLSSSTNAHAEIPSLSNYLIKVCYEDFVCESFSDDCGTGDASEHPLGVLSLSATTNAHIGPYNGTGSYFTKICCGGPSINFLSCNLLSATWDVEEAIEGQKVYPKVTGSGAECSGASVSFEVWEYDATLGDSRVTINPDPVKFSGATATGTWTAEWQNDGIPFNGNGDPPEYYFVATVVETSKTIESGKSIEELLSVKDLEEDYCLEVSSCEDYYDSGDILGSEACDANVCEDVPSSADPLCDPYASSCVCEWDSGSNSCLLVNNYAEGTCGDGTVNAGEQCESDSDIGLSCSDFDDFTGGDLSCVDCMIDTSACSGGEVTGTCKIIPVDTGDDCEDGYLEYSWTVEWTGLPENKPESCEDGSRVLACPAEIKLPFFNFYHTIITLTIIALIYILLIFKRKKK